MARGGVDLSFAVFCGVTSSVYVALRSLPDRFSVAGTSHFKFPNTLSYCSTYACVARALLDVEKGGQPLDQTVSADCFPPISSSVTPSLHPPADEEGSTTGVVRSTSHH